MTWTATVVDKAYGGGSSFTARVSMADGVNPPHDEIFPFASEPTDAELQAAVRRKAEQLDVAAVSKGKLTIQVGQQIDLALPTPIADTPPTTEQIAQAKFLRDWRSLQALNRAVAGGVIQPDDPRIAPLQQAVKNGWLDSYIGLV